MTLATSKNTAILRDFLSFWPWQRQKRSNSARLPQSSTLTTSKTKQLCETSFKNGSWVQSRRPRTSASYVFSIPSVQNIAPATKKFGQGLSGKIILANLKIWCSKMQPLSLNMFDGDVFCTAPPATQNAYLRILFATAAKLTRLVHFWQGADHCPCQVTQRLDVKKLSEHVVFSPFSLGNPRAFFPHLTSQKWSEPKVCIYIYDIYIYVFIYLYIYICI